MSQQNQKARLGDTETPLERIGLSQHEHDNIHNTGWICNRCNQKVADGQKSGRKLLETPVRPAD